MRRFLPRRRTWTAALILIALSSLVAPIVPTETSVAISVGSEAYQTAADIVSNSQFVLGPRSSDFGLAPYLREIGSPLARDADLIENWCVYASINPRVVLTLLELDGGQVSRGWRSDLPPEQRDGYVERLVMGLADRFYNHLYTSGERASGIRLPASVHLPDGTTSAFPGTGSSGSFAVLQTLAQTLSPEQYAAAASAGNYASFAATWERLFPQSNRLDSSLSITPDAAPPPDLFQFPFPVGQKWWFNGAHSWNGSGTTYGKPYSSMDFFTAAESCSTPPSGDWAVAAASGKGYHPGGASCWYRIDHDGGWTTSYYHLLNTAPGGQVAVNGQVGTIGCEICVGGFASSPHVHFSLLYNGAYVDLEGVQLSGWTIHSGSGDYRTGYLERGGVQLKPYASVLNEGVKPLGTATPTPSGTPPTPTSTPSLTATPTATATPNPSGVAAKYLYPKSTDLLRSCPVTLTADVSAPAGSQVRFFLGEGASAVEVGRDVNGTDGWQTQWDCQDTSDGSATLSLGVFDSGGKELLLGAGRTVISLSKKCNEGSYRTAFFANTALSGSPTSSWCKTSGISYNWGPASPGAGVTGSDNFSARFRGSWRFDAGSYRFTIHADDGVRVWIDRVLVLDEWHAKTPTGSFGFTRNLASGLHEIWLDYYEATGDAAVSLIWDRTSGGGGNEMKQLFLPLVVQ